MLKEIDPNVKNNFDYLKDYLLRKDKVTPNVELQVMGSCLGIIDAILDGKIILCEDAVEIPMQPTEPPDED
jgi:hypothetical protein